MKKEKRGEGVWLGTSSLTLENPEDRKVVYINRTIPQKAFLWNGRLTI
jgi:hypothetical protein